MKKNKFYVLLKNLLPDKLFLNLKYFKKFNKFVNFKNPVLFNQKINYLKIYDDMMTKLLSDKLKVKDINKKIGPHICRLEKSFKEQISIVLKTNLNNQIYMFK